MISEIVLFNSLKETLGDSKAQQLIEFLDARFESNKAEKFDHLATKSDLSLEIRKIENRIADIDLKIEQMRSDLLKWIIGLYMGGFFALTAMIVGLYFRK